MNKTKTLATLAFCLSAGRVHAANNDVDLQTLQLLEEESISYQNYQNLNAPVRPSDAGNYSRFGISSGNYSRFGISSGNYSRFGISSGNYSRFGISSSNYSRFGISGAPAAINNSATMIPAPIVSSDDIQE